MTPWNVNSTEPARKSKPTWKDSADKDKNTSGSVSASHASINPWCLLHLPRPKEFPTIHPEVWEEGMVSVGEVGDQALPLPTEWHVTKRVSVP